MLIFISTLFLISTDVERIDLEQFGFYHPYTISLHALGKNTLVLGRVEGLIVVLDPNGKALFRYDKQGQGPDELEHPRIWAIHQDTIVVLKQGRHFITFNHRLEPLTRSIPALPLQARQTIKLSDDEFLVKPPKRAQCLLVHLKRSGERWDVLGSYFPFKYSHHEDKAYLLHTFGDGAYVNKDYLPRGQYQVEFFPDITNRSKSLAIYGHLEGIEANLLKTYVDVTFRWKDHHVVCITQMEKGKMEPVALYYDVFDASGNFKGRFSRSPSLLATPVSGGSSVFELDTGSLVLTPLDLALTN